MSSQESLGKGREGKATSPGNQAYPKPDLEQTQLLLVGATQVLGRPSWVSVKYSEAQEDQKGTLPQAGDPGLKPGRLEGGR